MPSRSSLKRASAQEQRYLFELSSESWRRSSTSVTVASSESHTLATLRRTEFFGTYTRVKCSRSTQKEHTWLILTNPGYRHPTFVHTAGINRTKTTRCQSRPWGTKSTWSALCRLRASFGFHWLSATRTRTSCKCFCRSSQQYSRSSME